VVCPTKHRDLARWKSRGTLNAVTSIALIPQHLPNVSHLRKILVGSFLPSRGDFPVLPMTQICPFSTRNSPLARFVSKFIGLRELELGSVTWADAGGDVWPSLSLELEHLSILGFHQALDVLPWLSCAEYGPRTRGLALDMPNNADPASLRLVSIFLHRLDGHLHYLRLDVHPSYLQCASDFSRPFSIGSNSIFLRRCRDRYLSSAGSRVCGVCASGMVYISILPACRGPRVHAAHFPLFWKLLSVSRQAINSTSLFSTLTLCLICGYRTLIICSKTSSPTRL
jgi:hypothetical protein